MEEKFKRLISGEWKGVFPFVLRGLLWVLSFPYRWIVAMRNRRFDRGGNVSKVSRPVISVGNITTGGTGKTPLVCAIAGALAAKERKVVLLSRGYGAVEDDSGSARNDEALELAMRLPDVPHLQNKDRVSIAKQAIDEHHAEVILLDDGFQHRRLHRDLDIVVIDATIPFGHGHTLPRGLLREPLENLKRADIVLINRCESVTTEGLKEIERQIRLKAPNALVVKAETRTTSLIDLDGNVSGLDELNEKRVLGFCGIGNPKGFRSTLDGLSLQVVEFVEYPDHHHYSANDITELLAKAEQARCSALVCTHKDLVKLNQTDSNSIDIFAVLISIELTENADSFWKLVNQAASIHSKT